MLGFGKYDLYVDYKCREEKLNCDLKDYCKSEGINIEYFKYLLTLVKRK